MNTISFILQKAKSRLVKDLAVVFIGNLFGAALGFIATILITRILGPADFGLFSIALAVMGIVVQLSDFGISTGLVRFASLYFKTNKIKAALLLKVSLKLKIIIAVSIFLIGFFLSDFLAINIFQKSDSIIPLKLAFIGAFGASLAGYIPATLQARESFKNYSLFILIEPMAKISLIGLLSLALRLDLFGALTTVITIPFLSLLIGSLIIPKDFLKVAGNEKEPLKELFNFSKWILVSILCTMLMIRLDILMLGYFRVTQEVGFFSAAYTLASVFPLLTGTITTVLLPKVSQISNREQLRKYIIKSLKYSSFVVFPVIILLFISRPLILFIYGSQYLQSANIFRILVVGLALSVIVNPISLIFYALNKTRIAAYLNISQLFANFVSNIFLIPRFGAVGAAFASLVVAMIGSSFVGLYVYFTLFRTKSKVKSRLI